MNSRDRGKPCDRCLRIRAALNRMLRPSKRKKQ